MPYVVSIRGAGEETWTDILRTVNHEHAVSAAQNALANGIYEVRLISLNSQWREGALI